MRPHLPGGRLQRWRFRSDLVRQSLRSGEKIVSRLGNLRGDNEASAVVHDSASVVVDVAPFCRGDPAAAHIVGE
jgi:hypothetical protein